MKELLNKAFEANKDHRADHFKKFHKELPCRFTIQDVQGASLEEALEQGLIAKDVGTLSAKTGRYRYKIINKGLEVLGRKTDFPYNEL